jgi:hypothetical protein
MYVDVKVTVWQRIQLNEKDGVSVEEVIELLKNEGVSELWDDEKERFSPELENILETEEYMNIEDNDECPTIELYDDDDKFLWANGRLWI